MNRRCPLEHDMPGTGPVQVWLLIEEVGQRVPYDVGSA